MRKYLVIAFLVVAAVLLSLVLVPDAREIALMQFRDKEFDKARSAYEERFAAGDLTVDVVSTLTNLYLQSGDIDKAIGIMEKFIADNPNNITAYHELGKLYQFAQRPDDYLANLEKINKLQESSDSLSTMNEMYAASQQYDKQEPALEALVGRENQRQPQHYRNLIRLKSSQKKVADAVGVYKEFWEVHPTEFKFEDLDLMMSFQLELDDLDGAYQSASKYAQSKPKIKEIARIVNILHYRGNPDTAMKFLEPYDSQLAQHPALGVEKTYILLAQGKRGEVYDLLRWLDSEGALPINLQREYIALLAMRGENDLAYNRVKNLDFSALQEADAIALVDLALTYPDVNLMPIVSHELPESVADGYIVLEAAIAIANNSPKWKDALGLVNKRELTGSQNLQMANICLRSKKTSCVYEFLDAIDEGALSKSELVSVASLYMDIGSYDKASEIIDPLYRTSPDDAIVSRAYVQLAAADGRASIVEEWLNSNPNASEDVLRDIYFTAQRYRKSDIAINTVGILAKKYESEENLGFLIDAYISNGLYEAVLPYFREKSSLSANDREDYLFVLTKLARNSDRYSSELVEFARTEMNRSDIGSKQKQALVYALLEADRPDVVMPFIEDLARREGGQWIEVYASNLDRMGRYSEARDFRMRVAMAPGTSAATRRLIAYQVLDKGFKSDAIAVFSMLSDGASPNSSDVKQLVYLWGARPSADKIDWLAGKYVNSSSAINKSKWAGYISNKASRDDLIAVVSRFPSLIGNKQIQEQYFAALNEAGKLESYGDELLGYGDVPAETLRLFARAARGYNMQDYALSAYRQLNAITSGDPEALRVIGLLSFGKADYSETLANLLPYVEYRENNPGYHEEDYAAYFYLAESYKRDHNLDMAKFYYDKALEAVSVVKKEGVDSISKISQSLIGYGDEQKGRESFEMGRQKFSDDRLLLADYISSMIELKDYDSAVALLESAPSAKPYNDGSGYAMRLPASSSSRYKVDISGNEAVLRFGNAVPRSFPVINATKNQYPWLSYVGQSYDEVLVVAETGYELQIQKLSSGYGLVAVKKPNSAEEKFARELDVRYAMLDARIGLETGDHYDVTEDLLDLVQENPESATLLGYTANALNFTGRWKYAQKLLERANDIMPVNEDILALQRDINIRHDAENHVKLDYEWVGVGDSDQNIWTLSGLVHVDDELEVGMILQTADVDAVNVRRIDGRIGNFDEDVQRGELFVAHEDIEGQRIQASLYGNNDSVGLGLSYRWLNSVGMSRVYAEYQRPNWDFVEGMLDDATRDRIGFDHSYVHNTLWSFNGGVAFNRYNLKDASDVAKSVGATFSATRKLQDFGPYLALNYALDAEYRTSSKERTDNLGVQYFPLLDSREVHTLSVIAAEEFTPETDGLIQAGYSYDRLGGNGPLIAGQLTHQMFEEQLEAQIRGSYGARTSDSEGDTARVGGHLKWRF